ncbi:MAG: hypothetical protein GF331_10890 [Chitinivibrionales bacterium]|nr:hypothetical protein [Chitinivibrionales bacterium]
MSFRKDLFVLYVPLAWLGGNLLGLTGLFAGAALASFLSGILAFTWFEKRIARRGAPLGKPVCAAEPDAGA